MRRRLQGVSRDEVVVLKEVAPHLRRKKDHGGEKHQKDAGHQKIVNCVVRVEGDAVERNAVGALGGLDLDTVRVVRADVVQRQQMRHHQTDQSQRHGDHVESKETVQRGVAHHVITANQQREFFANKGDGSEQVDDDLSAPVAHLAPGQQIAHEGLGHQAQEDSAAKYPDQFTRFSVAAIHQPTEHVQVDDDEKRAGASGVHVTHQPAPRHITHDVFDRCKCQGRIGLVVHGQENACDDLQRQHQHGQSAKDVPEVEVLWGVVLRHVHAIGVKRGWKPVLEPYRELACHRRACRSFFEFSHIHLSAGALRPFSLCLLVVTDQQQAVGKVHVRGYFEVVGRGFVFEHTAREVEG